MATFVPFEVFSEDLASGVHDFSTHGLKLYLTNTAPDSAADAVLADLPTELANGNGYVTGGLTLDSIVLSRSGADSKVSIADEVMTATDAVGPFRYAVLYNSTASGGPLIGYWDRGSSLNLVADDTFTMNFDDAAGVLVFDA